MREKGTVLLNYMQDDAFEDFLEFDLTMGAEVVKCPHCGAG